MWLATVWSMQLVSSFKEFQCAKAPLRCFSPTLQNSIAALHLERNGIIIAHSTVQIYSVAK